MFLIFGQLFIAKLSIYSGSSGNVISFNDKHLVIAFSSIPETLLGIIISEIFLQLSNV